MKFRIEIEIGFKETALLSSTHNVRLFIQFAVNIADSKPFSLRCLSFSLCTSKFSLLFVMIYFGLNPIEQNNVKVFL